MCVDSLGGSGLGCAAEGFGILWIRCGAWGALWGSEGVQVLVAIF